MQNPIIGNTLYIRPHYIVSVPERENPTFNNSHLFIENQKNLLNNEVRGTLSNKSISKLKTAVNWLLCAAEHKTVYSKVRNRTFKFRIAFVTLTMPSQAVRVTPHAFKTGLLNPFLTLLRTHYGVKNYVWKLELTKAGTPHIHITIDSFIHYNTLRKLWNYQLKRRGYLDRFYKEYGHYNPNSTDIHSVKKVRNMAAYICKYMSKNTNDLNFKSGRLWSCNYELSRASKLSLSLHGSECQDNMRYLFTKSIKYKTMDVIDKVTSMPRVVGELFILKYSHWQNTIKGDIKAIFDKTLMQLRHIYTDTLEFYAV
jgi:hypothetical protein